MKRSQDSVGKKRINLVLSETDRIFLKELAEKRHMTVPEVISEWIDAARKLQCDNGLSKPISPIDLSGVFGNKSFYIANSDCMQILRNLPDETIDLFLTDPPYNLGLFMKRRATNLKAMRPNFFGAAGWDDLEFEQWKLSMDMFFSECARVARTGASMIIFMSIIKVETIIQLATKHGFYYKTTGIWHKLNPMPRNMNLHFINSTETWIYFVYKAHTGTFNNEGKVIHDFFETSVTPAGEKKHGKHPTQKPVAILEKFVTLLSNEGDMVLDPFMGVGSSGVAALKNNRKFIGIELNPTYCEIAERRLSELCQV